MSRYKGWIAAIAGGMVTIVSGVAEAQDFSQAVDSPAARMRPLGSASAVDQYRGRSDQATQAIFRETGYRNPVQQTAMQFALPGGSNSVSPPMTSPAPTSQFNSVQPGSLQPGSLQPGNFATNDFSSAPFPPGPVPATQSIPSGQALAPPPNFGQGNQPTTLPFPGPANAGPIQPRADYAPMIAPSLNDNISNINNCANVTGPSGYTAAFAAECGSGCGCLPVGYQAPVTYQAPPSQIAAPALVPGAPLNAPALGAPVAQNAAPIGSLLSFGQERYPVQVGQGLLGQPKAYVPGQTFRNWLRYFTP